MNARTTAAAAGLSLVVLATGAEAQQQFNGRWSVLVVTERGECDKAYRYPVAIENGRVRYAGDAAFTINGQVGRNGVVEGSIVSGSNRADVRGKLAGEAGSGSWTIAGARTCAGSWSAEKRG